MPACSAYAQTLRTGNSFVIRKIMALNINQQIMELVNGSHHLLLLTPPTDSGDGLTAALAFRLFLEKIMKPADLIITESQKNNFNFLPGIEKTKTTLGSLKKTVINLDLNKNKISEFNYDVIDDKLKIFITPESGLISPESITFSASEYKYNAILIFGSPDLESLGSLYAEHPDFFYETPLVNIDHSAANEHYGQINLIELNASSLSEIIFNFLEAINPEFIDEHLTTCLLTGLIIKTNSFRATHISPQCLSTASALMRLGGDHDLIMRHLNKNKTLATLNLWGRVLARLKEDTHYHLAWSLISQSDFEKSGAEPANLNGAVTELIAHSPPIEITVILYETAAGAINGKIFTSLNYNALELTKPFNSIGYQNQATFELKTTRLAEAEENVINEIRKRIKLKL